MTTSNEVADMALNTMLPGETSIIVKREGGSSVVQRNHVSAYVGSSYSVEGATVDISDNLGVNVGTLDFKVGTVKNSISYFHNTGS